MAQRRIYIIIIASVIIACIVLFMRCDTMRYNNVEDKDNLIKTTYLSSEIDKMKQRVNGNGISYKELESIFNIECLRKTNHGYYVILKQDDGRDVFIFISQEHSVGNVLIIDSFKSKEEFESYVRIGTARSDIESFDSSAIVIPISAKDSVAYYVEEGLFILTYSRSISKEGTKGQVVEDIYFYSNEELSTNQDTCTRFVVPFILEKDRVTE